MPYNVYKYLLPIIKNASLEKDYLELINLIKKMNLLTLRQNSIGNADNKNKLLNFLMDIKNKELSTLNKFINDLREYLEEHVDYNIDYLD